MTPRRSRWCRGVVLAALGTLAGACGDNGAREEVLGAVSGARLAVQWYGYPDGTRQPEAAELYDKHLHARCSPRRWIDGVVRCVPEADDAVFVDATCTELVGRALRLEEPTHFIGYDRVDGQLWPSRIYWAGDETDPISTYYQQVDGECVGPIFTPSDVTYHALAGGFSGAELVPIRDGEVGGGRLALGVRESDDGLRVPLGLRDRVLDVACTPTLQPDGGVTCEPSGAAPADFFRDPACGEPVVVVAAEAPVPTIAKLVEPGGCARYHALGPEVPPGLYRRDGEACRPAALVPVPRAFAVGPPLALPALERSLEVVGDRRLQRIVLDDGELRFFDDLLFDTATQADCRRHPLDDVTRCIPAVTATAVRLFTPTCVVAVPAVELPPRQCARPAFAIATTEGATEIRAIGDRVSGTLHHWDAGQCRPYTAATGAALHVLGPAIDPTAFMGAIYFGER